MMEIIIGERTSSTTRNLDHRMVGKACHHYHQPRSQTTTTVDKSLVVKPFHNRSGSIDSNTAALTAITDSITAESSWFEDNDSGSNGSGSWYRRGSGGGDDLSCYSSMLVNKQQQQYEEDAISHHSSSSNSSPKYSSRSSRDVLALKKSKRSSPKPVTPKKALSSSAPSVEGRTGDRRSAGRTQARSSVGGEDVGDIRQPRYAGPTVRIEDRFCLSFNQCETPADLFELRRYRAIVAPVVISEDDDDTEYAIGYGDDMYAMMHHHVRDDYYLKNTNANIIEDNTNFGSMYAGSGGPTSNLYETQGAPSTRRRSSQHHDQHQAADGRGVDNSHSSTSSPTHPSSERKTTSHHFGDDVVRSVLPTGARTFTPTILHNNSSITAAPSRRSGPIATATLRRPRDASGSHLHTLVE